MRCKFHLKISIILLSILSGGGSYAQKHTVTGLVTNELGEPFPGVAIVVTDTQVGVTTDRNGKYSIQMPDNAQELVFQVIGYEKQTIKVSKGQATLHVTMTVVDKDIDEVVVIGYGSMHRRDLTGAVAQVDVADMAMAPVSSVADALAGRLAGVQVSAYDGQPGAELNIVIRGSNSLTQSNAPLYVVDGVPIEDFDLGSINIEDIESMNVLKDASAIAIYGARAANGVFVITTKKGKSGEPVITFNAKVGFAQITRLMEMMSVYEYVRYLRELDSSKANSLYLNSLGRDLEYYRDIKGINWQEEILTNTPLAMFYDISMRGGSNKTKYSVSVGYTNQDGVINNTGQKKYRGNFNLTQNIGSKFKTDVSLRLNRSNDWGPFVASEGLSDANMPNTLYRAWGYRPYSVKDEDNFADMEDDDEFLTNNVFALNPKITNQNEYRNTVQDNITLSTFLEYNILPSLKLKILGAVTDKKSNSETFNNSHTMKGSPKNVNNARGQWGTSENFLRDTYTNENTLTYNKVFCRKHHLNILAGLSFEKSDTKTTGYTSIFVPYEELGIEAMSLGGIPFSTKYILGNYTMMSYYGRINYTYDSRYAATITFRADGSSKFAPTHKWGYFPSCALAWNMDKERFMKEQKVISAFKLRGSYGVTGNNRVGDYDYLGFMDPSLSNYYSFGGTSPQMGVGLLKMANPDLKWEETESYDVGMEVSFLKNRINIVADWYKKITNDLLLKSEVPAHTGLSIAMQNVGAVQNSGWEFSLNTVNIKIRKFVWASDLNMAFNRNKVLRLADGKPNRLDFSKSHSSYEKTPLFITEVGKPAGLFYGYIFDGVYQYSDFDEPSPGVYTLRPGITDNGEAVKPGFVKYRDVNGDLTVNAKDLVIIGSPHPDFIGGFNNNLNWNFDRIGKFNLSFLFQFSYGNQIYNANRLMFEGNGVDKPGLNQYASYANRWTPENQSNTLFKTNGQGPSGYMSNRTLEDGSYLRLKTLAFSYDLPKHWLAVIGIKRLALTASAQNLFTWTKYTGYDPEVSVLRSVLTPGFDFCAYPQMKTITFGVNLTL